jgi:hypothetical protein
MKIYLCTFFALSLHCFKPGQSANTRKLVELEVRLWFHHRSIPPHRHGCLSWQAGNETGKTGTVVCPELVYLRVVAVVAL